MRDYQIWENWVQEGDIMKDGFVELTDRPGLGVTMNEEVAKTRQIKGTPWFEEWPSD
jgi:L-alanine-DL-glutamate epimerase-like enolase superfamily enzyme